MAASGLRLRKIVSSVATVAALARIVPSQQASSSPLRKLMIGRLIGRSTRGSDLGFYSAPGAVGSFQNPTLQRRRPQRPEASYHRLTVPFSDLGNIDERVFFSLFGGSVSEYARFFAGVSLEGLNFNNAEDLKSVLSGASLPSTIIKQQPRGEDAASTAETGDVFSILPGFGAEGRSTPVVGVDRAEWVGLQTELNGGTPMSAGRQLPYFFDCAASFGPALAAAAGKTSTPPWGDILLSKAASSPSLFAFH